MGIPKEEREKIDASFNHFLKFMKKQILANGSVRPTMLACSDTNPGVGVLDLNGVGTIDKLSFVRSIGKDLAESVKDVYCIIHSIDSFVHVINKRSGEEKKSHCLATVAIDIYGRKRVDVSTYSRSLGGVLFTETTKDISLLNDMGWTVPETLRNESEEFSEDAPFLSEMMRSYKLTLLGERLKK